jgi:hypothetical protein
VLRGCWLVLVVLTGVAAGDQFVVRQPIGVVNPIAASRRIDWSYAGAGVIPTNQTKCGSTLATSSTAAQINTAIAGCAATANAPGYVLLANGTFTLTAQIVISKSYVTLRGGGPDQTTLLMSGYPQCTVYQAHLCITSAPSTSLDGANPANVMAISAGYTVGSTSITLGNGFLAGTQKPVVNSVIVLDQIVDAIARANDTWPADFVCVEIGPCTYGGPPDSPVDGRGSGATSRSLFQVVQVTSITGDATCSTGCTVGITPPIMSPDWKASLSPQAFWEGTAHIEGVGIENLTIKHDATDATTCNSLSATGGSCSAIGFELASRSWVKNVTITGEALRYAGGVDIEYSTQITVRDSYIFDTRINDDYGIDPRTSSSVLLENNIFQHIRTPLTCEACTGFVIAYNYTIATCDPTDLGGGSFWSYGAFVNHGSGSEFWLAEGNDAINLEVEDVHGALSFGTEFRNRFDGTDHSSICNNQTVPAFVYTLGRFHNYVGNVLGTSGYHTQYQTIAGGAVTNCIVSIYALGLGGDCLDASGPYPPNDTHVADSILRWGNWDTVNAATRWVNAEVPSGLTNFANPIPATQTLPSSEYLSAKPAFFKTHTYPPIGPDVSGGDVTNVGGHVWRIPARICFEDVMSGLYADTVSKTFNASNCY